VVSGEGNGATVDRRGGSGSRHDGPMADVGATALRWLTGRVTDDLPGQPFVGLAERRLRTV